MDPDQFLPPRQYVPHADCPHDYHLFKKIIIITYASNKTEFEITCGIVCIGEFLTQFWRRERIEVIRQNLKSLVYHKWFQILSYYFNPLLLITSILCLYRRVLKAWEDLMWRTSEGSEFHGLMMMMSWCLMSSDVIWHIRDKLWPMPKHGSIILYVHGNQKAR